MTIYVSKIKMHKARLEHRVPGRIRIKIPSAINDLGVFEKFKAVFRRIPSVTQVTPSSDTGSIVIHYDHRHEDEFQLHFADICAQHAISMGSALPGDEISELANNLEAEADFLAEESDLFKATVGFVKYVNNEIKVATDNQIDLKLVVGAGLAVFSFVKIGAEASMPMWVTLTLFAANHMIELNHQASVSAVAVPVSSTRR